MDSTTLRPFCPLNNRSMYRLLYLTLFLFGLFGNLAASEVTYPDSITPTEPRIEASLLICGEGKEIYQLEGHAALRLHRLPDAEGRGGFDIAVNWGVFDFNSPNFVYRFVKGETDYMAVAIPTEAFLSEYIHEGRRVTELPLNLTDAETRTLADAVAVNLQPENRTYRYNYIYDNCSTRPLELIERATGGEIKVETDDIDYPTFRQLMTAYHSEYPWYQFGIDLALGSGIDRQASPRQQLFAPVFAEAAAEVITLTRPGQYTPVPLIGSPREILLDNPEILRTDKTIITPMAVAVALTVITILLCIIDLWYRRTTLAGKIYDSTLYGIFFLAGCVLTFLVFISTHEATSPNWLLLWLNPLCLIPAVGEWIKSAKRVVYCYQFCNFVALVVLLFCHDRFGQALNPAFPLLILCDLMRSGTYIYLHTPKE